MTTCTHIKADGSLCRAVPMKNKTRCYFHQQAQARQRQLRHNRTLPMPLIEDVPSIQLALMDVVNRLAHGTIEPRNAGLILYALQIASSNLRTGRFTSKGWRDYQSRNAQLVQPEDAESRSKSVGETLIEMLTERREQCKAQAAQGISPDDDYPRSQPASAPTPEHESAPSPGGALIPSINAAAEEAVVGVPRTPSSAAFALGVIPSQGVSPTRDPLFFCLLSFRAAARNPYRYRTNADFNNTVEALGFSPGGETVSSGRGFAKARTPQALVCPYAS